MKNSQEYNDARDKAYKEAGHNAYFGNGFDAGFDFAMSQPKHIFDGVAQVGEVRRFEGGLVDVVDGSCKDCHLEHHKKLSNCGYITLCGVYRVKYIKR